MRGYYLDASALIKRYATELGTAEVVDLLREATDVYTASVAYAELIMAFRRKRDEGTLQAEQLDHLLRDLDKEWEGFNRIGLSDRVLRLVKDRCRRHPLRALNAIHLASALLLQEAGVDLAFVCSDHRLKDAASREGLKVVDPVENRQ